MRALTYGLRLARSRAIAQDREVAVVTAPGGFSVDGGAPWAVPADETLSASQVVFTAGRWINGRNDPARRWSEADRCRSELADRTRACAGNRQPMTGPDVAVSPPFFSDNRNGAARDQRLRQ